MPTVIRKLLSVLFIAFFWIILPVLVLLWLGMFVYLKIPKAAEDVSFERVALNLRPAGANGVAWGDVNGDGADDLFVSVYGNCSDQYSKYRQQSGLHINKGGVLKNESGAYGLADIGSASSAYFADYDGDGRLDLFVMSSCYSQPDFTSRIRVFRNTGNHFTEVTDAVGMGTPVKSQQGGMAIGDLNGDGYLDVAASYSGIFPVVTSIELPNLHLSLKDIAYGQDWMREVCGKEDIAAFLDSAPEALKKLEEDTRLSGEDIKARAACVYIFRDLAPGIVSPLTSLLYRPKFNLGVFLEPGILKTFRNDHGRFTEVPNPLSSSDGSLFLHHTLSAGLGVRDWPYIADEFFQPSFVDMNGDGISDVLVAVAGGRTGVLLNDGKMNFKEDGSFGLTTLGGWMGIAQGDPYRAGKLSLLVTNIGSAYRLDPKPEGGYKIIDDNSINNLGLGWGSAYFDANNDGWPDLYISNGLLLKSATTSPLYLAVRNARLYRNNGGNGMEDISLSIHPRVDFPTRAMAVADVNSDGLPDIAIGGFRWDDQNGAHILKNTSPNTNTFLKVALRQDGPNRFAIGSKIVVYANGSAQAQAVAIGESFYSEHSLTKIFGLGHYASSTARAIITWPDNSTEEVYLPVGTTTTVYKK